MRHILLSNPSVTVIPLHRELVSGSAAETETLTSWVTGGKTAVWLYCGGERGHFCIDCWQGDMKREVIDSIPGLHPEPRSLHRCAISKIRPNQTAVNPPVERKHTCHQPCGSNKNQKQTQEILMSNVAWSNGTNKDTQHHTHNNDGEINR